MGRSKFDHNSPVPEPGIDAVREERSAYSHALVGLAEADGHSFIDDVPNHFVSAVSAKSVQCMCAGTMHAT